MNFLRSRLSVGALLGQRSRQITQTWSHRGMCIKPQEVKAAPPANASNSGFKIPGIKPSDMDKKFLIWSGRFKTADQIPELVSVEMIDAARNKLRVKVCYVMVAATVVVCMVMMFLGRQSARRHESLTAINITKKARWREELEKEGEALVSQPQKPQ